MRLETLIWFIPLPPLIAFAVIALFTSKKRALSHGLAIAAASLSWLMCMVIVYQVINQTNLVDHPMHSQITWFEVGTQPFILGAQVDPLGALVLFFVAWTVLMIFIYSAGYHNFGKPEGKSDQPGLPPHGVEESVDGKTKISPSVEPMYGRFFAFISLFAFAMFLLVISDNLLTLYIGWEIMGLCSYLLIGFWYAKPKARDAAVKAFITTRVGDVFMLLGLVFLYSQTGSLQYSVLFSQPVIQNLTSLSTGVLGLNGAALAGLLLFVGVVGKSAQWPLHVWLPDAMEGPTPVSAMIHAATMVSAGVYLAIRIYPLLSAGWVTGQPLTTAMTVVSIVGAFTALFAATIAVTQRDIKRTLAYSTISQLGYMIAAVGIGAPLVAAFHLLTHAFFKALLFLGSGSVIHGVEHGQMHTGEHGDAQDMFRMGGLARKMPTTFITFSIGGLALAGFPLITAGFWSKDAILSAAFGISGRVIFWVLVAAAFLTAFYTMRQITLTFLGKARTESSHHAQESARSMVVPLIILAVFAIGLGWIGIPLAFPVIGGILPDWLAGFLGGKGEESLSSYLPIIMSVSVSLTGLLLGWLVYRKQSSIEKDPLSISEKVYAFIQRGYDFDRLYAFLFVRPAKWLSEVFTSQWVDKGVIDGFLHVIGRGALGLGRVVRKGIDVPLINGGADLTGKGIQSTGGELRKIQTGQVQQYMVMSIFALGIVAALLIVFLGK
ncbi:MAG: NADH-quinone oxidoreductase subunit L [Anaerolineaceae bacterium]